MGVSKEPRPGCSEAGHKPPSLTSSSAQQCLSGRAAGLRKRQEFTILMPASKQRGRFPPYLLVKVGSDSSSAAGVEGLLAAQWDAQLGPEAKRRQKATLPSPLGVPTRDIGRDTEAQNSSEVRKATLLLRGEAEAWLQPTEVPEGPSLPTPSPYLLRTWGTPLAHPCLGTCAHLPAQPHAGPLAQVGPWVWGRQVRRPWEALVPGKGSPQEPRARGGCGCELGPDPTATPSPGHRIRGGPSGCCDHVPSLVGQGCHTGPSHVTGLSGGQRGQWVWKGVTLPWVLHRRWGCVSPSCPHPVLSEQPLISDFHIWFLRD